MPDRAKKMLVLRPRVLGTKDLALRSGFRGRHRLLRSESGHVLWSGAQAEHLEVRQLVLEHIDQPVVALRIDGGHVEPRMKHEGRVVRDQPFDNLTVLEGRAHPEAIRSRKMVVKAEVVVRLPLKRFDEEDGFDTTKRHCLHDRGPQRLKLRGRSMKVGVFSRSVRARGISLYRAVAILNDEHVEVCAVTRRDLARCDWTGAGGATRSTVQAWGVDTVLGLSSYCLILYSRAL